MEYLEHYGTPRHSGRYPWGSGKNPQRNKNFKSRVDELRKKGLSDVDIAKGFNMSTTTLRARYSNATNEIKKENIERANRLKEKGYSNVKIGELMNVPESTVRNWLKPDALEKRSSTEQIADILKKNVDEKGYIDVGKGVELSLNTTDTKLKNAIALLEEQGYVKTTVQVDQLGTGEGQKTSIKVLAPPGTTYKDVNMNQDKIRSIEDYSSNDENKVSKLGLPPVRSISSDRIKIVYSEDGGGEKDGVIELRRGVEDLSLGNAKYAQVRIGVDDKYYLKGMALYSDNLPPGVDVIFNTSKSKDKPLEKVLKEMKTTTLEDGTKIIDKDNPFGASIKAEKDLVRVPRYYEDAEGNKQVSAINVVNEEGDWGTWSKTLASQMLSKQPNPLVKRQLEMSYEIKKTEFEKITQLDNAAVKRIMLESFANDCDASSVHLKAAALPRQASYVILPIDTLKENEIYAPRFRPGETVALVRYPHAGTFEIPMLTVTHKNPQANAIMHNAIDAVGINSAAAQKLSGADFDGDTVLVIPVNENTKIKATKQLDGLKDFDPKKEYPIDRLDDPKQDRKVNPPPMTSKGKQVEMGKITNLITDMTVKLAPEEDLVRAVRHSMVVIDAEKHDLDYRKSAKIERIDELKAKYQIQPDGTVGGASTIISRAKSREIVYTRKELSPDPVTGEKRYEIKDDDTYLEKKKVVDKVTKEVSYIPTGKIKHRTMDSTKMAETSDARTLISDYNTLNEQEYAKYANRLKSLANEARKEYMNTTMAKYDPEAAKAYAKEVASLNSKLNIALKNAPRERQAQLLANQIVAEKKSGNSEADSDTIKKWRGQALATARARLGASKQQIIFTDREWEAVQARAISPTKLMKILKNADMDDVKKKATPKQSRGLTPAQISRIKSWNKAGYQLSDIADKLGVSTSTVSKYLNS